MINFVIVALDIKFNKKGLETFATRYKKNRKVLRLFFTLRPLIQKTRGERVESKISLNPNTHINDLFSLTHIK